MRIEEVMDPALVEILKESGGIFAWEITKWTIFGIAGGTVAAVLIFFLLIIVGAYRLDWAYARWARIFVFVSTLLISTVLSSLIGFNQGLLVAVEQSLQSDQFRKNILPTIGSAAADLIATIYVVAPGLTKDNSSWTQSTKHLDARLKTFRKGEWELDINLLSQRLKNSRKKVVQEIVSRMDSSLKDDYPILNEGIGEKIYDWSTNYFAESIVENAEENVTESVDSLHWIKAGIADLKEAGSSDPKVSHHELSIVVAEVLINKGIISPVRSAVRIQQLIFLISLAVLFVTPVLIFRIAEFVKSRKTEKPA